MESGRGILISSKLDAQLVDTANALRVHTAAYRNPGDICAITALFHLSAGKLANFQLFRAPFQRNGIPMIIVECVFGDVPWLLPEEPGVIRVRASDALWQKERLINVALAHVPRKCAKVAWVDADVLFENPGWAVEASNLLDDVPVVQLAERAILLSFGQQSNDVGAQSIDTFAAVYALEPNAQTRGEFGTHGHTGFGWAARRSVLEAGGLYDACIAGGGDHLMAHAFCGDWDSRCVLKMLGENSAWYRHAAAWSEKIYPLVRARLGCVPGTILHLWHGDMATRRHGIRYEQVRAAHFDPAVDVALSPGGSWEWASRKPILHQALSEYMDVRRNEAELKPFQVTVNGQTARNS